MGWDGMGSTLVGLNGGNVREQGSEHDPRIFLF